MQSLDLDEECPRQRTAGCVCRCGGRPFLRGELPGQFNHDEYDCKLLSGEGTYRFGPFVLSTILLARR